MTSTDLSEYTAAAQEPFEDGWYLPNKLNITHSTSNLAITARTHPNP